MASVVASLPPPLLLPARKSHMGNFPSSPVSLLSVWFLWISRNNASFRNGHFSHARIISEIIGAVSLSGNLSKGVMKNSISDFSMLRAFHISGHLSKAPRILQISWHPPLAGWCKCYTDRTARGSLGIAARGGIYRDFRGSFMGCFSLSLGDGVASSLVAEITGTMEAIELLSRKDGIACGRWNRVSFVVKASGESSESSTTLTVFKSVQNIWDQPEDRLGLIGLGFAAVAAFWASTNLIAAIDKLPLFPTVLELVGIFYSVWFTYRYLIFKPDREELFQILNKSASDILGQ
ncbi:Protein CURVATURE THYLAKOID 1C, chloroplastic [Glycine soja]|nr:Protein CURVATURE THYLAKOID 1C, chloroplastic [Glycine max]